MKKFILLMCCLFITPVFAEGDGGALETGNYTTTAIGAASAVPTTVISVKKFKAAHLMRENARNFILKPSSGGKPQALTDSQVKIVQSHIDNGDEIRFIYHRGPEANKQLHLDRMWDEVESAQSSARMNRYFALQAMAETKRVQTGTDADGRPIYTTVPDPKPMKALMYNNMADADDARATELIVKHTNAKSKPASSFAPIKLEKVVSTDSEGVNKAKNFVRSMTNEGGKFYQSSEIPAKVVEKARKIRLKGTLAGAGAFLGVGFAVEELVYGAASNIIFNDERERASGDWVRMDDNGERYRSKTRSYDK